MQNIYSFLDTGKIDYKTIKDDSIIVLYDYEKEFDINFIIPVRGRLNFANSMYKSFCKAKEKTDLKIAYTVVEFSHIPEHSKFCKQNKINYIWIKSEENQLFNKCLCLNFGALFTIKSKSFLFHDIDCLIQSDFFIKLFTNIEYKNSRAIQCFHGRRVLYLNQELTDRVLNKTIDVDDLKLGQQGVDLPFYIGAPGGSIYVEKDLFFQVGGYDPELFQANAPEDSFFWKKIDSISKMDVCDNPEIEIFHMNHRPTYYDNPLVDQMKMIYNTFDQSDLSDRLEFIQKKMNLIKQFLNK